MKKHLLLLALLGCAHGPSFPAVEPPSTGVSTERPAGPFSVGVARADLTPPPAAATFGHGPDAHIALGYWLRLECRAFVFSTGSAPQDQLAIVPCDLAAIGLLLHRKVAARVSDLLPETRLMLTATHTHFGPAHYLESHAYGGPTSSRWPGYDEAMADFLAERIAGAVRAAWLARAPARLRWVHADVWGLTRNRSLDAWRVNPAPYLAPGADPALPLDERAVDPALDVLQLQRSSDDAPLGWLVFFAMHPTVLRASNRLFTGDVYGVAVRALEAALGGQAPVGMVNTNEGDLVPVYARATIDESVRVGTQLANTVLQRVHDAGAQGFTDQAAIDARWLELDLDDVLLDGAPLCHAELGQAATRGASDHRSSIEFLSKDAPDTDLKDPCGPRRKAMALLQDLIAGPESFPDRVALALVRVGPVLLPFVPAELTVTSGHVLDEVVLRFGPVAERAVVAGLANAYIQYVATEAEFEVQAYEGASTLYGRRTLPLLAHHFETLARALRGEDVSARTRGPGEGQVDAVLAVTFDVATERPRLARPEFNDPAASLGTERRFRTLCQLRSAPGEPAQLCAVWDDVGPGRIWADSRDQLVEVRPWVSLRDGAMSVLDDRGLAFQVRTRGPRCGFDEKAWRWTARVSPTAQDWLRLGARTVRLQVDNRVAVPLWSPAFTSTSLPPVCDLATMRLCVSEAPAECP